MKSKLWVFCFLSIAVSSRGQDSLPYSSLKEYPVLFQQVAAEYRALCYQAFNIAVDRLNCIPKRKYRKERLAIITDLDETILDNSYSEAALIRQGKQYDPQNWMEWTAKSAATAVPGAVEFLKEASRRGISIFYISNRSLADRPSTLINLQRLGLPDADTAHMMFLSGGPSKEERRQKVMSQYTVVMLLGDNLNDFMNVFESRSIEDRFAETDKWKSEWGSRFIVLPNATYGEWENALYQYKRNLSPQQKESLRLGLLKGY